MSEAEFNIIEAWFANPAHKLLATQTDAGIALGIGDDCAIINPPGNQQLLVSMDTLISGVHFPDHTPAEAIAHKALAVNLSDLAAMGAKPAWFTLALTLPEADKSWLNAFSQSLFNLAQKYQIALVGGDTTCGALSITIQVAGYAPVGRALKRSTAQVGDVIAVTGELGAAAIGLDIALQQNPSCYQCLSKSQQQDALLALNYPSPKIKAGLLLREYANSALDLSDGLVSDLGHILKASGVGADINLQQLPLAEALQCLKPELAWQKALTGGDDYQLCFTINQDKWQQLAAMCPNFKAIGVITQRNELRLLKPTGAPFQLSAKGYNHFE